MTNTDKAKKKPNAKSVTEKAPEASRDEASVPAEVAMSTDAFSKETLTEFRRRVKGIKDSIGKIDSSLEKIAFNLHWINAKQAYKSEGYNSIVEYAGDAFGYKKTTCYSFISVVDRFAERDEKGALIESFDERVKGYSVSKLSLMVNLTDAEIACLNPGMTVRDIKVFVKSCMAKPLPPLSEGGSNAEDEEGGRSRADSGARRDVIDAESREVVRQVLIACEGREDYDSKIDKIDDYVNCVLKKHPDAVIEVSYVLPKTPGEEG